MTITTDTIEVLRWVTASPSTSLRTLRLPLTREPEPFADHAGRSRSRLHYRFKLGSGEYAETSVIVWTDTVQNVATSPLGSVFVGTDSWRAE